MIHRNWPTGQEKATWGSHTNPTVTQIHYSRVAYTYDAANLALDTETIQYDLDHNGSHHCHFQV